MNLNSTKDRVSPHLRQYVVEQDYSAYDEVDQAVWRFILQQTYHQHKTAAHPAYVNGLQETGISVERIPKIEEMNQCLSNFGWGAVCVNGFIPPRAFQEFQALKILTIAADIRTADHLAYTPAPDIIHESAGHAPIIPDAIYRDFLQQFGELGKKAFSSQDDMNVYEAIRHLSIVKEDPHSTTTQIQDSESNLDHALNSVSSISEASLLSRLHWWTVEYGLVGTPQEYKTFGAGILSSVAESVFLHLPSVKKIPLSADCVTYNYDITEQQPQLFVTKDFDQLHQVLHEVAADFAFNTGGLSSLQTAKNSQELCTIAFNSGLQVSGILQQIVKKEAAYLSLSGPCALAFKGTQLAKHDKSRHPDGFGMPLGPLANGTELSKLSESGLKALGYNEPGSRLSFTYQSGVKLQGKLEQITRSPEGFPLILTFKDCLVTLGDQLLFDPSWGNYDLALGETVTSAFPGAADDSYLAETEFPNETFPKKKHYSDSESLLVDAYRQTNAAKNATKKPVALENVTKTLLNSYPDHWLLPWNILEMFSEKERQSPLAHKLISFMKSAESRHPREAPVTLGLKYLGLAK